MSSEHEPEHEHDEPSLRQRLHAATGDRAAEARAVADRDDDVDERDAKVAVQRARGERGIAAGEPEPDHELATTEDAEAVRAERTS